MNDSVIHIERLGKTYQQGGFSHQRIRALHDVTLEVKRGEIVAILGLNGAGKSTLVKILLGLVRATEGRAALFGEPVNGNTWKDRVGYLPEVFRVPQDQSATAILCFLGAISGLNGSRLRERVEECLEIVGLSNVSSRKAKTYSKGMILRLGIAQAILSEPELVFLDEPTEGLDPVGKVDIRNLLMNLSQRGITVVMNSHLLSEVEYVAHRVAILHRGQVRREGKLSDLLPDSSRFVVELSVQLDLPPRWKPVTVANSTRCEVETVQQLQEFLGFLKSKGVEPASVRPERSTLEEVFLKYISDTQ